MFDPGMQPGHCTVVRRSEFVTGFGRAPLSFVGLFGAAGCSFPSRVESRDRFCGGQKLSRQVAVSGASCSGPYSVTGRGGGRAAGPMRLVWIDREAGTNPGPGLWTVVRPRAVAETLTSVPEEPDRDLRPGSAVYRPVIHPTRLETRTKESNV